MRAPPGKYNLAIPSQASASRRATMFIFRAVVAYTKVMIDTT